jgi:ribosomal protein S18 acetylase RimI-like enzyme
LYSDYIEEVAKNQPDTNELEIQPVGLEAVEQILELYRRCEDFLALGPVPTASRSMVLADLELSAQNRGKFCAIRSGKDRPLVGVIDFIPQGYEGDPRLAYLALLMIDPAYRSQAWGYRAVQWAEQEIAKQPGLEAILVSVQVNNPRARRFWERHGYRVFAGPDLQPDGTTVFHLRKQITS